MLHLSRGGTPRLYALSHLTTSLSPLILIPCLAPQNPPVMWVHPCNCTLIAHESCLLSWIQSAQQDPSRSGNALKCPQCGAIYEIESDNPLALRILNHFNSSLSVVGRVVSGAGLICIVGSLGFGQSTRLLSRLPTFAECIPRVSTDVSPYTPYMHEASNSLLLCKYRYIHHMHILWRICCPRVPRKGTLYSSTYRRPFQLALARLS